MRRLLLSAVVASVMALAGAVEAQQQLQQGQQPDPAKAAEVRAAAERGDREAQFGLAKMLAEGRGVPQDHAQAVVWYRMAAEQGHVRAQWSGRRRTQDACS